MNTITIIGRLAKDPEPKTTQSGKTLTKFVVADERKTQSGNKVSYFSCTAWGKKGEFIAQYFKKGKPISLYGSCYIDSVDRDDGKKDYFTVVEVIDAAFVPGAPAEQNRQDDGGLSFE